MLDDRLASLSALALAAQRAIPDDRPLSPTLLTFLLRRYAATGGDELLRTLEPALTRVVVESSDARLVDEANWIAFLVEACGLSRDERLHATLAAEGVRLAALDFSVGKTRDLFRSVSQLIAIAGTIAADESDRSRDVLRCAIDGLEAVTARAYEPGAGIADAIPSGGSRARSALDQVVAASALLAGFFESARLPYSMLAEEVVQFARRRWWDKSRGRFDARRAEERSAPLSDADFEVNAEAARLFCQLARLHQDRAYRQSAVVAPEADYHADLDRVIDALAADAHMRSGALIGLYGLAVDEQLRLRANLQ